MSLMWMTAGDRDLLDEVRALIAECGSPADVDVFTGSVNPQHVATLARLRDVGTIGRLRLIVDAGFLAKRARFEQPAHREVDAAVGRESARVLRTHAKGVAVSGPNGSAALICSANLNTNRSHEFYERLDGEFGTLRAIADQVFATAPAGCEGVTQAEAGTTLRDALVAMSRAGVHVHDSAVRVPSRVIAPGLWALYRGSIGDFVEGAVERVGSPATVWSSGINILIEQVHMLKALRPSLADLRVYLPPAAVSKGSGDALHAHLLVHLPGAVRWVDTHVKALIVSGPRGVVCATGSANLAPTGALEFVHVSMLHDDHAQVRRLLEAVPPVVDPTPPSDAAMEKAKRATITAWREHSDNADEPAAQITPAMLQVSPRFQPPTGLGASTQALRMEAARQGMLGDLELFVWFCWPILNPGTRFVSSPLIGLICRQFMAFVHGTCAEITVNRQPPGTTKSTIVSHIGPIWAWLHYPHHRWGFASHSLGQAVKDSQARRDILASDAFQTVFRPGAGLPSWEIVLRDEAEEVTRRASRAWRMVRGQDAKAKFVNDLRGSMRATSTGARLTGDHFDRLVGDDLLDGSQRGKPEAAVDWTFNVFLTRRREASFVWLNGQALHARDPGGVAVERAREAGMLGVAGVGGTDFLCFPHHYAPDDPERRCVTSTGVADWRTAAGDLLVPDLFPEAWLRAKAAGMGPLDYAMQYEQNTRSESVQIFDPTWWQRFDVDPGGGWLEVSIDSSNWSERKQADLTAITLGRVVGGRLYRLRCWADRYTLPETVTLVGRISLEHPTIRRWHVEDRAGGRGLIQSMAAGGEVDGTKWRIPRPLIVPVNPQALGGDLDFRADAAAPAVRARRCYVLAGEEGDAFINDCAKFPNVWPDDAIASWVQLATDPAISKQLGARTNTGLPPRMSVSRASVDARRSAR